AARPAIPSFPTRRSSDLGHVGVAFFGDGAVNNGAFHEGLNLASIWKLPALFVCENNQYATEVPFSYAAGNPSVANRAASYGMPGDRKSTRLNSSHSPISY